MRERPFATSGEITEAAQEFVNVLGTVNRAKFIEELDRILGGGLPVSDATHYLRRALSRVLLVDAPMCPACGNEAEKPAYHPTQPYARGSGTVCDHPFHPADLIAAILRVHPEYRPFRPRRSTFRPTNTDAGRL